MARTTAQYSPVDIDSEDSVFRQLFSDEQKPRKATQTERLAHVFADAKTMEPDIKVNDFFPIY